MKGAALAIAASVGVHALIAAALVFYFAHAPGPEVFVCLDLSSVELSLAERDVDVPALAPMPTFAPQKASPAPEAKPPELPRTETNPLPPDQNAMAVDPPEGEVVPMEERREADPMEKEPKKEQDQLDVAPAPQDAPQQARIDAKPSPTRKIRPHYPSGARLRGEQGDVVLEIHVGADGFVDKVSVVETSGFADLDAAAVKAVRAARFTPAKSGGKSVASAALMTLKFRLRN